MGSRHLARRDIERRAACIAIAALVSTAICGSQSVRAGDVGATPPVIRIAAAGGSEPAAFAFHLDVPRAAVEADLRLLFAQNGQLSANDATPSDDTILVRFAGTEPQSIDDDIAKQYSLELVDRTELFAFGWRVVRYRVPDDRPAASIITQLRNDHRIRGVQGLVQYGLPVPRVTGTEISRSKEQPAAQRQPKHSDPVSHRADRKAETADRPATTAGARTRKDDRPDKVRRALASAAQAPLRFPTADEPFVNVGVTGKE
jgi:hypothetical protein